MCKETKAQDMRQDSASLEVTAVRLLNSLARATVANADERIDKALSSLGEVAGLDRTYLFWVRENQFFDNTHEWVAPGIEPMIAHLQGLPVEMFGPFWESFQRDEAVYIARVADLPDDQAYEREMLSEQGIISLLMVPVVDDGQPLGFVGYDAVRQARDFSDSDILLLRSVANGIGALKMRVQADLALRDSRDRLEAVLLAMPDILVEVDAQGHVAAFHSARESDNLIKREEAVGKHLDHLVPGDVAGIAASMMAASASGQAAAPQRFPLPLGEREQWFEARIATWQGAESGYLFIIRDITREHDAARHEEIRIQQLQQIFDSGPIGIVLSDAETGAFLDANPAFLRATGYDRDQFRQLKMENVTDENGLAAAREQLQRLRAEGRYGPIDQTLYRADRTIAHVKLSGVLTTDMEGHKAVWHFVDDQTDRRAHEAEIEQRKLEAELATQRLTAAVDALIDGFVIYDRDNRLVMCNQPYRDHFPVSGKLIQPGMSYDEILRLRLEHGEYRHAAGREEDWIAERKAQLQKHFAENEQQLSDGRWFRTYERRTPDGGRVGLRTDITELRKAQQRLEMVIDGAQIGTWEWDLAARRTTINSVWCAMIGRPAEQNVLSKQDFAEMVHPEDAEWAAAQLSLLADGTSDKLDFTPRLRHADGRSIWVRFRGRVVRKDASGRATHMSGVALDVTEQVEREQAVIATRDALAEALTERQAAEERLKANEERFQIVTRASGTVVWEWDVINDRDWWSEGFQQVFGHAPDDANVQPTKWMMHIHPDDKSRVDASIQRLIDGEADFAHETYRFRRADGSWANVEDRSFAYRDEGGQVVRVLGSMTDISEKVQLEERLRQSQKMEAVGQLTGGIAHDFNNLLTIILGNAEILSEELEEEPALQRLADMTMGAADRASELTSRLLAFSRKQVLAPKIVDPGALLVEMDRLLRRTLPEHIDLQILRADGLWKAELDVSQLESALLNLALNARDAMPDGGWLTLEASNAVIDDDYASLEAGLVAGEYVLLTVTDTGHGIPKDALQRVFEPFFTTKEAGKGSGLGLSMVYGFVKQSGGHLRVYSEIGDGTSFKLYFPRAFPREEAPQDSPVERTLARGVERILVVEDEAQVREHVLSQLGSLGYQVVGAASGVEAHEMLKNGLRIDLLFTDVIMPGGMSGRELAEKARELHPELRVLFTSGYPENSIMSNGKLEPGVQLLSKPYRRETLAAKVRMVLDK